MSYATGHNSFTSQYLLSIYIYCRFCGLWSRVSQMKTVKTFLKIIHWAKEKHICVIFLHNLPHAQYKFSKTYKVPEFLWKQILLVGCATSHAPLSIPLHPIGTYFPPVPPWAVQTCDNHWGQDLVSKEDVADPQNAHLQWSQLLHGQYEPEHCHGTKWHL
jgi:hypothetical protein